MVNPFLSYLQQQPQPASPRYDALLDVLGRGQQSDTEDYSPDSAVIPQPSRQQASADILRDDAASGTALSGFRSPQDIGGVPHRNAALVQRLRSQFGLGRDVGDISQADLEDAERSMREDALADQERSRQSALLAADEASRRSAQTAEDIYKRPGQALKRQQDFAAQLALQRAAHPDQATFPGLTALQPTPTPYGVDPSAQPQSRDVTAQARAMQAARSGVPAPTTAASSNDDWEGRFEQLAAGIPEPTRSSLRGILKYQEQVPSGSTARKAFEPLVGIAMQIDPSFDISKYEARQKAQNNITSGETMQKIRSLNALAGHSTDLQGLQKNINNWNIGAAANPLINWLKQKTTGYAAPSEFDKTSGLVTSELGKLLAGGAATNELRESISGGVNSGSSDAAISGNIHSTADLARRQWDAILSEVQGLPRSEELQHMMRQQLTPAAWKFLEGAGNSQPAAAQPAAAAQAGPAEGTRRAIQGGGTAVFHNGQWIRES